MTYEAVFKPVLPIIAVQLLTPERVQDIYQYLVEEFDSFPALKTHTVEQLCYNKTTHQITVGSTGSLIAEPGWYLMCSTNGTYHFTDNTRVLKGVVPPGCPHELFLPDELIPVSL